MVLGGLGAVPSYLVLVWRTRTHIDETLDVLAAHGIAGFTGIVFIGFFAEMNWNGVADGLFYGDGGQLVSQLVAAVAAPVYAFVATYALLRVIGAVMPLRGPDDHEAVGMDIIHHGEEAYATGEGALLIGAELTPKEKVGAGARE
jgi:Amt family ammonium transporter